ncbi:NusG domain II-containing protein [Lachnospiraceae bacterium ZAX-1]
MEWFAVLPSGEIVSMALKCQVIYDEMVHRLYDCGKAAKRNRKARSEMYHKTFQANGVFMVEKSTKRFRHYDLIFLSAMILIGTALFCFYLFGFKKSGNEVVITVNNTVYGTYPLNENIQLPIKIDDTTTNILEIENGVAFMQWANCPDKLCMHQKEINAAGESIICLPNKVIVSVIGREQSQFDSVAGDKIGADMLSP